MAIPNVWRTKCERYRLQRQLCPVCSIAIFPPRRICPRCRQSLLAQPGIKVKLPFVMQLAAPVAALPAVVVAGDD